ncbi:MAG: DUF7210 family protein [Pikeienuella sp.]
MIVVFTKAHNYGGQPYQKDDPLDCPDSRAKMLIKAGVAKKQTAKKSKTDEATD